MNSMPQLESILIEMIVNAADLSLISFDATVALAADRTGGAAVFNVRIDDHVKYQRVAAVERQSGGGYVLLLLDRTGTSIEVHDAPLESHPSVVSVASWAKLPLRIQVATNCSSEVLELVSGFGLDNDPID